MEEPDTSTGEPATSTGLDPRVGGLLAYLIPPITGLVLLLLEKRNEVVRWHAAQSVVLGIVGFVLVVVCYVVFVALVMGTAFAGAYGGHEPAAFLFLLAPLLWAGLLLTGLAVWVVCLIKGASGEPWRFPLVADLAGQLVRWPGAGQT